jgi:hypothetical protein
MRRHTLWTYRSPLSFIRCSSHLRHNSIGHFNRRFTTLIIFGAAVTGQEAPLIVEVEPLIRSDLRGILKKPATR